MDNSFTLGSTEEADNVKILQSCNGLLLCSGSVLSAFDYVYNPSTNLFKRLPQPGNSHDDSHFHVSVILRMAFDPRKSLDYKEIPDSTQENQLWITPLVSLRKLIMLTTQGWPSGKRVCGYHSKMCEVSSSIPASAIYWNDAFHWLETENMLLKHYKLNIKDHDHLIITAIEIPLGLHMGRNILESFGGSSDDPILMLMEIPQMLHLEGKFFESRGCLLLVCRDDIGSREFTIYGMMKGCSTWSVRYLVNTEEIMNPLIEEWSIWSTVWSIGLREREEDAFLLINLSRKVVKYNLISKTINEIFNIGSNQMDDDDDDVEFIRPFQLILTFMSSFCLLQVCNLVLEFVH
ncbi:hypothetical protein Tco_0431821 [Tanacetum coccineum]